MFASVAVSANLALLLGIFCLPVGCCGAEWCGSCLHFSAPHAEMIGALSDRIHLAPFAASVSRVGRADWLCAEDVEASIGRPVGREDHDVCAGTARGRQQQPVVFEPVRSAAELAASNHVVGREFRCSDAEAPHQLGVGEVENASQGKLDRVDGAPSAGRDRLDGYLVTLPRRGRPRG